MKTKLATLLIAPALLFTACGAKTLTIDEVSQFIKDHYKHTSQAVVDGKMKASWDFSKITDTVMKEQFILQLKTRTGLEEVKDKDNEVDCPNFTKTGLVMNSEIWEQELKRLYYGTIITVTNDELTMKGPNYRPILNGNVPNILTIDQTVTCNNEGALRYQSNEIKAVDIDSKHYEGFMTLTITDIKVTEPTL